MIFDGLFKKTYISVVFLTFLLSVLTLNASGADRKSVNCGLTFRAHSYNQDERTGLDLSPDGSFRFDDGFSLEFDLSLFRENLAFGYVFRIISDDFESLDLVTNFNNGRINFILSKGYDMIDNLDFSSEVDLEESRWLKIKVQVCTDSIKCSVDSLEKTIPVSFTRIKNIKILFGKNDSNHYFTTDVPPMSVRNVELSGMGRGMPVYFWELYRHNGDDVYDSVKGKKASASNGVWKIDGHTRWKKKVEIKTMNTCPQVSFFADKVYVSDSDSIKVYDIGTGILDKAQIKHGMPYRNGGSQIVYNHIDSTLFSYSLSSKSFVKYDFSTSSWSAGQSEVWPPIQNSSRAIDYDTDCLYIFGGYGNHIYNSNLIAYDLKTAERREKHLDEISPRYLSAIGVYENKLYILGGYGSVSGRQEEFPKNMYDLYVLDLDTGTVVSKKEFKSDIEPLVFCNSLVYDGDTFYTLGFDNSRFMSELMLVSFRVEDGEENELRIWADRIPFRFHDLESFSDLILDKENKCFYAIVQNAKGAETNEIEIYELSYPPLDAASVLQFTDNGKSYVLYALELSVLIIIVAVMGIFIVPRYRKSKHQKVAPVGSNDVPQTDSALDFGSPEKSSYCISLLGDFSIKGLKGVDITLSMSPVIRQIFIMILLRNADGKGVLSQMLDETFWPDMDRDRAANNRNVNIRKLRLLLPKIGDIKLVCSNSLWVLNTGPQVTCDYVEIKALLKSFSETDDPGDLLVQKILLLAERGPLLPNVEYEWLDVFKSRYTDVLIDVLTKISVSPKYSGNDKVMSKIAKVLLMHDSIDENAVRLLCRILHKQGHNGQAKQVFDKFCADYRMLLGESADMTFDEFLGK